MSQFLASSLIGWRRWSYLPSVVSMVTGPSKVFFQRCPARDHVNIQPTLLTFGQKVKLVQAEPSTNVKGDQPVTRKIIRVSPSISPTQRHTVLLNKVAVKIHSFAESLDELRLVASTYAVQAPVDDNYYMIIIVIIYAVVMVKMTVRVRIGNEYV